jgi:hypothetical protein
MFLSAQLASFLVRDNQGPGTTPTLNVGKNEEAKRGNQKKRGGWRMTLDEGL